MAIEQKTRVGFLVFTRNLKNNKVRNLSSIGNQEMRMLQVKSPDKLIIFCSTNGSCVLPQATLSENEINNSSNNLTNRVIFGFIKRTYSWRT
jgi:hypothetical protein